MSEFLQIHLLCRFTEILFFYSAKFAEFAKFEKIYKYRQLETRKTIRLKKH